MTQITLVVFRGPLGIVEAAALWLAVLGCIAAVLTAAVILTRRRRRRRAAPADEWQEGEGRWR